MATLLEHKKYTPEDLLALDGDALYELVDGELVEKNMGAESSQVGFEIASLIRLHTKPRKLGHVVVETTFQCFPKFPGRVRIPDAAFIANGKLPGEKLPKGHIEVLPDLAIEVISPNDIMYDVETKVDEYIDAGVRQVWIVSPESLYVRVRRLNGPTTELRGNDIIYGEDILPGFSCPVSDFFQTI